MSNKKEKTISIIDLLTYISLFISITFHFSIAQENKFFSVDAKNIVDPQGKKILLKGINLGNWLVPEGYMFKFKETSSPRLIYTLFNELVGEEAANKFWDSFRHNYITFEDIKFIKDIGLNSIRIPFSYKLFITDPPYFEFKGVGYELLDSVIQWCKTVNLYIILDMHCAPGGQTGDNIDDSYGYPFLFESEINKNLTISVWKKIASIYKDESTIIGYDLLNEPIAHYFNTEKLNPLLEPFYKQITKAIREVDINHLIFIGGAQWNSNFSIFGEPFDNKLVYTFHKYWTDPTQEVIQEYLDFSNKYNVPLWMGESGENNNDWINNFRNILERNNIGWCFWPYKKMDSESCIASINKPEEFDLIINYSENERNNFKLIRENRPDQSKVKSILYEFLQNCSLRKCRINQNYISAFGLKY